MGHGLSGRLALEVERDDARRRLVVTVREQLRVEEAIAFFQQQEDEGTWQYGVLFDGRLRNARFKPDEMRAVLAHLDQMTARLGPPGPIAIVRTDMAGYGAARRFAIQSSDRHRLVRAFVDIARAHAWLSEVVEA
jgi:hypothetical protein